MSNERFARPAVRTKLYRLAQIRRPADAGGILLKFRRAVGVRAPLKGTRRGSQWIFADRPSVLGVLQRFNALLVGSQNCMIFGRLLPL